MNVKELTVPERVLKDEALLRRLRKGHHKIAIIQEDLQKRNSGFLGEQSIAYHLKELDDSYLTLHDLRLNNDERFFQLDGLILHPCFFLNLEVKNMAGSLLIDSTFNQLIRNNNGREEGFRDPITQTRLQEQQFKKWLQKNNFYENVPIISVVVFTNSKCVIKATSPEVNKYVIHQDQLLFKIDELTKRYKQKIVSPQNLLKLSSQLKVSHQPIQTNILEAYNIQVQDVILGVQCPFCSSIPMKRAARKWFCSNCNQFDKQAHVQAIEDYLLLIKPTITNRECREFLLLDSVDVSKRLLKSSQLSYAGVKKGTFYFLTKDEKSLRI